jgi:4-aminobutyrate aminotransferase-like enzyme
MIGHNHPMAKQALLNCLYNNVPFHMQASKQLHAKRLEEQLNEIINEDLTNSIKSELFHSHLNSELKYKLTLANTGTEAVEAALKHALLSWRTKIDHLTIRLGGPQIAKKSCKALMRALEDPEDGGPVLVCLEGSFHGKTAGALAVNGNQSYFGMYGKQLLKSVAVTREASRECIEEVFERYVMRGLVDGKVDEKMKMGKVSRIAAVILEPIQGEGGIWELSSTFFRNLMEVLREHGVPLIVDEIQSGMYRTGTFLATTGILSDIVKEKATTWSDEKKLAMGYWVPDYILLGKSLGGGLTKISAMLVRGMINCSLETSHFTVRRMSTKINFFKTLFRISISVLLFHNSHLHVRL